MDADVHPVTVPGAHDVVAIAALPIVPPGTRLEPGGVYLDLACPGRGPFVALPGQVAGSGNRYVACRDLGCRQWWRLVTADAHAVTPAEAPEPPSRPGDEGVVQFAGAASLAAAP